MPDDQFDRVPPQDIDAEMSVPGAMWVATPWLSPDKPAAVLAKGAQTRGKPPPPGRWNRGSYPAKAWHT